MSGGAFGGARGYQPRPPEKGVFPLDHFGECKNMKDTYMTCLKDNSGAAEPCKELAKLYLECRMDKNLMAQQDLRELGFNEVDRESRVPLKPREDARSKEQRGFVAGVAQFQRKSSSSSSSPSPNSASSSTKDTKS